jgi:hypothetical protein
VLTQTVFAACCVLHAQVGGAIKKLTLADITAYEKSGSINVAGHELGPGEIKVGAGFYQRWAKVLWPAHNVCD